MHTPPPCPSPADGQRNRPLPAASHAPPRPRLWLIAGTGEGPQLAAALLARGWRLTVSVVTPAATRAYPSHPDLELLVGPLGAGPAQTPEVAVTAALQQARREGDGWSWLVDATHPFACRISAALARSCASAGQPLLRLQRPLLAVRDATLLEDLPQLADLLRPGERLLQVIGARRLAEAIALTPQVLHHARLLPSPQALRQALAAGLPPDRLACLRPGIGSAAVEAALCRRWCIETVLCRQAGGASEGRWHQLCGELGLRLLLLRRPAEPAGVCALPLEALLARIGSPLL